jgi:hypothetical protein
VRGRVEEIVGIGAADPAPGHSDQGRLEHELTASGDLTALIAENRRLLADVDRLRDLACTASSRTAVQPAAPDGRPASRSR